MNAERIRLILHPLTAALLLIWLQLSFFFPDPARVTAGLHASVIFSALMLGIAFGLAGCPGCALPLGLSLFVWEKNRTRVFLSMLLFNIARVLMIFFYSLAGALGIRLIQGVSARYMFIASGIIMFFLGIVIIRNRPGTLTPFAAKPRSRGLLLTYTLWGAMLGAPCAFEATGFMAPLWLHPAAVSFKVLALFVFSASTALPVILLAVLVYAGVKETGRFFSRSKRYIRMFAFYYLTLLGGLFIATQYLP